MPLVADPAAARPKCKLAHVFREYGADYRRTHRLPFSHRRVMQAIEQCRTPALGGHMEQCNLCGFEHPAYDSCRNRHCPKCQSLTKARWLEKQKSKLLPVGAFHPVFTLPHELMLELTGLDITRCPRCKTGTLTFLAILPARKSYPAGWDSS